MGNKYLTLDCNLEVKYQEKVERDNGPVAESENITSGDKAGQGIFSSWFGGQKVEEKTKTLPALLISPIVQPERGEQENELNEEEGRKICVDGDDIEFSGPLMITFLKDRISLFCSKSLVREEIPSASAPPSQRWSSVSSLSLARRANI